MRPHNISSIMIRFIIILLLGYGFTVGETKLDQFKWILGNWKMKVKNGYIYEIWKKENDSTYKGISYNVRETSDTIMLENVDLNYRDNHYYYIPTTANQNNQQPVIFKIVSISPGNFTAENPNHDFPQRISYSLQSDKELKAIIDGKVNGNYRKQEFAFSKVE